ncbi:cytochrome P450 [Xylariomycetidae sp. FL0641]|nr:cytochrome P450 [Xylariomycetidae sp. FL0641]
MGATCLDKTLTINSCVSFGRTYPGYNVPSRTRKLIVCSSAWNRPKPLTSQIYSFAGIGIDLVLKSHDTGSVTTSIIRNTFVEFEMATSSAWLPEWWPLSTVVTCAAAVITLYAVAYQLCTRKHDPNEPHVVAPLIPYVGHLLGMAIYGGKYMKGLGLRNRNFPVLTLPVPNSRIYLVTDPSLAAAVQRASKTLSFTPIIPEVTERVLGLDKPTMQIVRKNLDPGPGQEHGFLADTQEMVYAWFGPGEYLNEITLDAARELRHEVASLGDSKRSGKPSGKPEDLLLLVRHLVTLSTAKYLYGPQNPIALDPELEDAFWDFDHGLGSLLMNIAPSITASKAYRGREKLVKALEEYLQTGKHKTGSKIIQKRVEIALQHGWTLEAAARSELSFLFAGIVNATTSTFWILLQIYADSDLLTMVRGEVSLVLRNDNYGTQRSRISITDLKDRCPMLVAVYRECLRLGSDNYSTRLVKENFMLADRYFLKKDSVVQIAGGVIHADQTIWGDNVEKFNPHRFLDKKAPQARGSKQNQIHPAAFRAFGGGKTLCPGRHFAMNEILSLVALMILQFDMESVDGGRIQVPKKNDGVLPVHILEPVRPVMVRITKRRDGFAANGLDVEFEI